MLNRLPSIARSHALTIAMAARLSGRAMASDHTLPPVGILPPGQVLCPTVDALKTHYQRRVKKSERCVEAAVKIPVSIEPVVITKTSTHVLFIVRVRKLRGYMTPMLTVWRVRNRDL